MALPMVANKPISIPSMVRIARRYLSIPASEVGVLRGVCFQEGRDPLGLRPKRTTPGDDGRWLNEY